MGEHPAGCEPAAISWGFGLNLTALSLPRYGNAVRIKRNPFLVTIPFGAMLLCLPESKAADAEDPAVIEVQARRQAVKTFSAVIKVTDAISKGAMVRRQSATSPYNDFPSADTTHDAINRLVLDGEKIRYEDNYGILANMLGGSTVQRKLVVTFDGEITKTLSEMALPGSQRPHGDVRREHFDPRYGLDLAPLLMTFRGNSKLAWYDISELKPTGRHLAIDGASCAEYSAPTRGGDGVLFWLDPTRNLIIRRIRVNGPPVRHLDIAYREHEVCGWVPESWVFQRIDPVRGVTRTTRYEIRELRINEAQPAELFDISFPIGIVISDSQSGKFKEYVLQPDGSQKPWNWQEHATSKSKPPAPEPWFRTNRWLFRTACAVIAILVLGFIGFRFRKRRNIRA